MSINGKLHVKAAAEAVVENEDAKLEVSMILLQLISFCCILSLVNLNTS